MKVCNKCKIERPFAMFSACKQFKDGLQYTCKDCLRAYRVANGEKLRAQKAAYGLANADVLKVKKAEYYAVNKDMLREKHRAYHEENKDKRAARDLANVDKIREYQKSYAPAYYEANKEAMRPRMNAYSRVYKSNNLDKVSAWEAKRRAKKLNATPFWSDLSAIQQFYEDAKTLEGIFGWKFHVDHIVPLNHPLVSGLHVPANLQLLSAADNLSKSNKFNIEEYIP